MWKGDWLGNGHGTAWNTFRQLAVVRLRPQVLLPAMPPRPLTDGADESGISSSPSGIRVRVPLSAGAYVDGMCVLQQLRCQKFSGGMKIASNFALVINDKYGT